jgi:hypothetical protein
MRQPRATNPKIYMKKISLILLILVPFFCYSQFEKANNEMIKETNPDFENYENLLLQATDYILSNTLDVKNPEFIGASKIVAFWMDRDTWFAIPIGTTFHQTLSKDKNQKFLNIISMINYILHQKESNQRLLKNKLVKGQIYKDQDDVREVQLEGAKIFLTYAIKPENKITLSTETQIYLEAYKNGSLKEELLKN